LSVLGNVRLTPTTTSGSEPSGWMPRERWDALVRGEGCPLCRHLAAGSEPNQFRHVVANLAVSQLWLATNQSVPGYCVLVYRRHVREPYELPRDERIAFFEDMSLVGAALERAFGAVKMNFEVLGNAVPHLHCHIKPRSYGDPAPGKPIHPDDRTLLLSAEGYSQRVAAIRRALDEAGTSWASR
jgi:diadenosine tetraphosphate (Ap4A) HIT family hydrolase